MASFDIPFERSAGIVVVVGEASFAGIVMGRWKTRDGRRTEIMQSKAAKNNKQEAESWLQE